MLKEAQQADWETLLHSACWVSIFLNDSLPLDFYLDFVGKIGYA